jgi:hypothetical protein
MAITPIIEPTTSLKNARIGYKNLLVTTNSTAADKMLIPNTFERFISGPSAYTLKFQLAGITAIDFVAIGAHNAGTHSGGVNILVKYAATIGGALTTIENLEFADNSAKMVLFDEIQAAEIALVFSVATGLELGVFYAGKALEMEQPIYGGHSPIDLSSKAQYESVISESGNFLGRTIKRQGVESTFSWQHLSPLWYRENFQPFVLSAKTIPFFIMWRPDLYDGAVFGFTTKDIKPMNMGGGSGLMNVSINVMGHSE